MISTWYRVLWVIVLGLFLTLGLASPVIAQVVEDDCFLFGLCDETIDPTNMTITCTGGTVCTQANMGTNLYSTQVTASGLPTFQISNINSTGLAAGEVGTAFLVVLVPTGTSPLTFSANGNAATDLGTWAEGDGLTRFGFLMASGAVAPDSLGPTADSGIGSYLSLVQAVDPSIAGFDVYLIDLGAYTDGTVIDVAFGGIDGLPAGTLFWTFLTDSNNVAVNSTSLHKSLVVTPEPGSMILLGTGLLAAGAFLRRRWVKKI